MNSTINQYSSLKNFFGRPTRFMSACFVSNLVNLQDGLLPLIDRLPFTSTPKMIPRVSSSIEILTSQTVVLTPITKKHYLIVELTHFFLMQVGVGPLNRCPQSCREQNKKYSTHQIFLQFQGRPLFYSSAFSSLYLLYAFPMLSPFRSRKAIVEALLPRTSFLQHTK